jgi:hypothetical protein
MGEFESKGSTFGQGRPFRNQDKSSHSFARRHCMAEGGIVWHREALHGSGTYCAEMSSRAQRRRMSR